MKDKALLYLKSGLSVLPAKRMKKYPAIGGWKAYQERLPSQMEVETWFANEHDALCLVCGKVSGNLEVIDFDHNGELFPAWKAKVAPDLLAKLVIEQTPSGGYHVAYRAASPVCGNIKLAQGRRENNKVTTLIETRGEGGLFLCAPSDSKDAMVSSSSGFSFSLSSKTLLFVTAKPNPPKQSVTDIKRSSFVPSLYLTQISDSTSSTVGGWHISTQCASTV